MNYELRHGKYFKFECHSGPVPSIMLDLIRVLMAFVELCFKMYSEKLLYDIF